MWPSYRHRQVAVKGRPTSFQLPITGVLPHVAAVGLVAAISAGYVLFWHSGRARVIHEALYRDIDSANFATEKNRKQHLINLAGLCRIMDDCIRYGDKNGVQKSRHANTFP